MTKGFNDFNTDSDEFNVWQFFIKNALSKIRTAFLAKVLKVYKDKTLVDVLPIIKGIDADGNELKQSPVFRLPYFQYRGGINQITITPDIGDYGLCIASDRDITDFKLYTKETKPASLRMFDSRDSLYIGGFLNKGEIKNYIEITDNKIETKTQGDLVFYADNDTTIYSKGDVSIQSEKDVDVLATGQINLLSSSSADKSSVLITNDSIVMNVDNQTMQLNKDGLTIRTNKVDIETNNYTLKVIENLNIHVNGNTSITLDNDATINSNTHLTVNADNYLTQALTAFNLVSNKINFTGLNNLALIFTTQGVTQIEGQLLATTATVTPPILKEHNTNGTSVLTTRKSVLTNDETATYGTLTTSSLFTFNEFLSYLSDDGLRFKITIASQELEIHIENSIVQSYTSYVELVEGINTQLNNLAELELITDISDKFKLKYTTRGLGTVDGYISYMEDIIENINATSGILTTGDLGEWDNFVNSLANQNLAFRISASMSNIIYQILFDDIINCNSYNELANHINDLHSELNVSSNGNQLVFKTVKTGSANGRISYMKQTDTPNTPATIVSGELDSFSTFKNSLNNNSFAVQNKVNNIDKIYYISNTDLEQIENYTDFLNKVFSDLDITVDYLLSNKINISTRTSGNEATLTYYQTVEKIDATESKLETAYLPDFAQIKEAYIENTMEFEGYINVNSKKETFTIAADDFKDFENWSDVANYLNNLATNININYDSSLNKIVFKLKQTGRIDISYMKYDSPTEEEDPTIDLSSVIYASETYGTITIGTDEINNIAKDSADLLKLTESTGAILTNGKTLSFATNSINLLKGTQDTGAKLVQGRDGTIVIINNSATLLKGTMEEGAIRIPGSDSGIPDVYDGIAKINGKLLVTNQVESDGLVINNNTNLTGEIILNPYDIDEEGEVYRKSSVIVNGGIIAENISVSENAKIEHLTVNDGADISGDMNLNNTKINCNGNTISFTGSGVKNNKMFIGSDFEAS